MNDDSELYGRYYNKEEEDKFWRELERKELRKEARAEGRLEGILQNQTETILNMYKNDLDIKLIAKYNNLTIEKVNEIINNNINDKNKSK